MKLFQHSRHINLVPFFSKKGLTLTLFLLAGLLAKAAAPVITTQPATQTVCPNLGLPVTFTVVATGTGLSYKW